MASLRLEGVRKAFVDRGRETVVVHDVTLSVADGEFLVLVGPSGCGKSTTLRMIAGLESVTAGTISIGDRNVTELPAKDRDIAMVFQNYALYPHMSVRRNLAFALELRGLPRDEVDRRVMTAAEMLGLVELLDRKPRQLSGGQRQRVAVGRAIVRSPQVFLFDEPLSNLDAKLRVQMRRQLAALRRQLGTTTVYVTHDQVEAMTMGDRIVVMKEGRVQQAADPLTLYQRPANTFVATFMGSPPMNLIRGAVSGRNGATVFRADEGGLTIPLGEGALPAAGQPVILGVRPEGWTVGGGVEGAVRELEPLGNESFALVDVGGSEVTVRLDGAASVHRGEPIRLGVPAESRHWFDAASEVRIG